jgi:hypothetical protein
VLLTHGDSIENVAPGFHTIATSGEIVAGTALPARDCAFFTAGTGLLCGRTWPSILHLTTFVMLSQSIPNLKGLRTRPARFSPFSFTPRWSSVSMDVT